MPFIILILSHKRWVAITLMSFIIICQLMQANNLVNKLNRFTAKCEEEKQVIIDDHNAKYNKALYDLNRLSDDLDKETKKEKVIYNERKTRVETIVKTNTVYADCKLDDGMRKELREATTTK